MNSFFFFLSELIVNRILIVSIVVNKISSSSLKTLHFSGKLPTYPSPKPTLTLTSHLGQNVGLREGQVGSFLGTFYDPTLLPAYKIRINGLIFFLL